MANTKTKLIGRSAQSDLALAHASVSRRHARVDRAEDGRLFIHDEQSRNGTWLYRSGRWIKAESISLCREDLLRCGALEVKPEQLAGLFGPENRAWLPSLPQTSIPGAAERADGMESGHADKRIRKPRRNPVTGQIEENYD